MKNDELIDKIIAIEERFKEIVKVLEEKELVKDFSYRELYKGVISIQSKITFEPEILFIGINPGCGAFTKKNYKTGKTYYFPKELISENKLNWLEENNTRCEKWLEVDKKAKNTFPRQMLDILYKISDNKLNISRDEDLKLFINEINNKIVYTNFCPIATKSTNELKIIYKKLSDENSLKDHWNGTVKNFFRQRTIDLILLLQPKLIVCVGNSVYKDLFLKDTSKKGKVFSTIGVLKREGCEYPFKTVTFSRKGAWDTKKISELILKSEKLN